jgi:hypothetical protein
MKISKEKLMQLEFIFTLSSQNLTYFRHCARYRGISNEKEDTIEFIE